MNHCWLHRLFAVSFPHVRGIRSRYRWPRFQLQLEPLEDRTSPAIGDLVATFQHTPAVGERFGAAVAAVGNNVLIGAPGVTVSGQEAAGAAYLLNGTTGAVLQTFNNPTPLANEQFGFSVAAVGSNVLIGAPFAKVGTHFSAGEAYLYDGSTGALLATFNLASAADDDHFGYSVGSVSSIAGGSNVLVGAPGVTVNGHFSAGAAYRFNSTTFALLNTYNNPDPGDGELFGFAIDGGGNGVSIEVLVGAPFANVGAIQSAGSAYRVDGNTGAILQTLISPTPASGNGFGKAVLASIRPLVGDPHIGAVFQFNFAGNQVLNIFQDPNPTPGSAFGSSIAYLSTNVLIGAPDAGLGASLAGAAYLFDEGSAGLIQTFVNPDIDADDNFGFAVASIGTRALIGTPGESSTASFAGKAYAYNFNALAMAARKDGVADSIAIRLFPGSAFYIELFDGRPRVTEVVTPISGPVPLLVVGADGDDLTLKIQEGVSLPPGSVFRAGNGTGDELQVFNLDTYITVTDSNLATVHAGSAALTGFEFGDLNGSASTSDLTYMASGFSGPVALRGGGGNDLLVGGPHGQFMTGSVGDDTLLGGGGNDTLNGGNDNDLVFGEDGDDSFTGSTGNDSVVGGRGEDTAFYFLLAGQTTAILRDDRLIIPGVRTDTLSSIESVTLSGSGGADFLDARSFSGRTWLLGRTGKDTLLGGKGNDILEGESGDDSLSGGPGTDMLRVSNFELIGTNFTLTNSKVTGSLGTDMHTGMEAAFFDLKFDASKLNAAAFTRGPVTVIGSIGNDTLTGGSKNDFLDGGAGNDKLDGQRGNDSLTAGTGNDTVIGGLGMDQFLKDYRSSAGLGWALINTRLTVTGSINSIDQLNGVERASLIGGNGGPDSMNASAFTLGALTLQGGGGSDTLIGGSKDDFLIGGDGDDSLAGGNGNDILFGGNGTDRVSAFGAGDFTLSNAGLTVTGPLGTDTFTDTLEQAALTGDASNQTLNASAFAGSATLLGGAGNDCLFGGSGNDSLQGDDGNDFLDGKGANDTLSGNSGQDSLNGGTGIDRLVEILNGSSTLTNANLDNGGVSMEALASIEQASLTGGSFGELIDASAFTLGPVTLNGGGGNDLLVGGSANDLLLGGGDNDTLNGGGGVDTANGGSGSDTAFSAEIKIGIP